MLPAVHSISLLAGHYPSQISSNFVQLVLVIARLGLPSVQGLVPIQVLRASAPGFEFTNHSKLAASSSSVVGGAGCEAHAAAHNSRHVCCTAVCKHATIVSSGTTLPLANLMH
jgi:hypothetical protein